jgi:hypothetical protein
VLRLIASATGLVLLALLALVAPAGAQQAPGLSLSATLGQGYGDGERAMAVTAQGVAPSEGTRLYVHYDQEVEDCPAGDPEFELGEGDWVMTSPAGAPFWRLGEGDFVEEEEIFVRQGPARLCGYLVQDDELGDPLPALVVTGTLTTVERNPTIALDRQAVIATLLASRRVPRKVRAWISQGERFEELQLAGPSWVRFRDLTGDGRADAIVEVSSGGARGPQAFLVVTEHGGTARVVLSVRRPSEVDVSARGRTLTETAAVYGRMDPTYCPGRLAVRKLRWSGRRFDVVSPRRLVRSPCAKAARPIVSQPTPMPRPVTPPPPAPSDTYSCDDFPLADGTAAQEYLNRYPSDPSGLDGDNDGQACE